MASCATAGTVVVLRTFRMPLRFQHNLTTVSQPRRPQSSTLWSQSCTPVNLWQPSHAPVFTSRSEGEVQWIAASKRWTFAWGVEGLLLQTNSSRVFGGAEPGVDAAF